MRYLTPFIAASVVIGCGAAFAKRGSETLPEVRETGRSVSCIPIVQIRESRVRNDQVIDFRVSGKKWFRNTLPHSCPSLGFEERYSYTTSLSSLCSTDIITVIQGPGLSRGASCGLGTFQPVELVGK